MLEKITKFAKTEKIAIICSAAPIFLSITVKYIANIEMSMPVQIMQYSLAFGMAWAGILLERWYNYRMQAKKHGD